MKPGRGVIGVGYTGSKHARVLSELGEAELAGVYDIDAAKAEAVGMRYAVPFYAEASALPSQPVLSAACVCTPPQPTERRP